MKLLKRVIIVHFYFLFFAGKKLENIQKRLIIALQMCIYYQPALLVLLDIDAIAGKSNQPEFKTEEILSLM